MSEADHQLTLNFAERPRHRRRRDPETSRRAARSADEDKKVGQIVQAAMSDGVPRTDELIHARVLAMGHRYSPDRVRHGRLWCQDKGILRDSGLTMATQWGRASVLWELNDA